MIQSIKDAGYDVLDLAHNHILDTGIEGLKYTANAFRKKRTWYFRVKSTLWRHSCKKEVNGIKVAILDLRMDSTESKQPLPTKNITTTYTIWICKRVKQLIQRAEEIADFTIVLHKWEKNTFTQHKDKSIRITKWLNGVPMWFSEDIHM